VNDVEVHCSKKQNVLLLLVRGQPALLPTTAFVKMAAQKSSAQPKQYPFLFGGFASGGAACFTHPLDLLKVSLFYYKK
jgi:hypothetical protein